MLAMTSVIVHYTF